MIQLTEQQSNIIKKLVENTQKVPNQNFLGLSSGGLEKLGINRRTFEINLDLMLHNQLIKIIHEEKHNRQKWRYYDITQLGFLALLKWLPQKELLKIDVKKFGRFIPYIAIHWDELIRLYDDEIYSILKQSIEQLEIKPLFTDLNISKTKQPAWNKVFVENTRLEFSDPGVEMIFTRVFGVYSDKEKEQAEENGIKLYFPNFEDMRNSVIKRLTFVFFFNLIRAPLEISLHHDLWNVKPKIGIPSKDEIDKQAKKFGLQYKKTLNRMDKASSEVISMIRYDQELMSIIHENLDEIVPKSTQPKIITILRDQLT
jgi:DNA-binding PadR family transcriptional regulator